MDPRTRKMADVIVNYSVPIKRGDWVVIRTSALGEPLADACVEAVLKAGGNPTVELSASKETLLRMADDEQLQFISPVLETTIGQADVLITIQAPSNTRALSGIDPARLALFNTGYERITQIYVDRSARGELAWTIAQFPTEAAAQDAGMSLGDYEEFVYGAGLLDEPDPVAAWQRLGERQQRLIDWLSDKSEVRITGPGTDLRLNIEGRIWKNDEGRTNFPGGEIFTAPVEDRTEGTIQFNYPTIFGGREVDGVHLTFEGGRVVNATARTDETYLHHMLDMDDGAKCLGEFAIGTNPGIQRFTRNVLFDEKIGGTVHMALGQTYPETGGTNSSNLHWDMVFNMRQGAEMTVDGQMFYRNGEICVSTSGGPTTSI